LGTPADALLEKKIELLRRGTDYRLVLETVAAICQSSSELPENVLASVADAVLRPIARDISSLVRGSKVMLHIYVSGE